MALTEGYTDYSRQTLAPGALRRETVHAATCGGCRRQAEWPVTTRREAERELRYDGWDAAGGEWRCPDCLPAARKERTGE